MSKKINDGGAAFPVLDSCGSGLSLRHRGMSLRDYFAGQAMNGFTSNLGSWDNDWDIFAENAYRMADAMIKARGE